MKLKYMIQISLKYEIFNFIKKTIIILRILTSILSFVNKSLTISSFSFSIAAYKAVL